MEHRRTFTGHHLQKKALFPNGKRATVRGTTFILLPKQKRFSITLERGTFSACFAGSLEVTFPALLPPLFT